MNTRSLDELFESKEKLLIGRGTLEGSADLELDHSSVGLSHALLRRKDGVLEIQPINAFRPVYLRGQELQGTTQLAENERVLIGPYILWHEGGRLHLLDNSLGVDLEVRDLTCVVPRRNHKPRTLLDRVTFSVKRGEFLAVLGTSGSGKSTLMRCLLGKQGFQDGTILANGEDYLANFIAYRTLLGYVPQYDILHRELTATETLGFVARLRDPDMEREPGRIQTRVRKLLDRVQIEPEDQAQFLSKLSGGQVRRVTLASELLTSPRLFFADEATSGLDPGTDRQIMMLLRDLAKKDGAAVVCITHNVGSLDCCDKLIVLHQGRCLFEGPPKDALKHFQVAEFSAIYEKLEQPASRRTTDGPEPSPARAETPAPVDSRWTRLRAKGMPVDSRWARLRAKGIKAAHQFGVLTHRYSRLVTASRVTLLITLASPAVVGALIAFAFHDEPFRGQILTFRKAESDELTKLEILANLKLEQEPDWLGSFVQFAREGKPVMPDKTITVYQPSHTLLYIVVIAVVWFGTAGAAKEVVKERAVYLQERLSGLGIVPYLASKFTVLCLLGFLQTALFLIVVRGGLIGAGNPLPDQYSLPCLEEYVVLIVATVAAVATGLLISSLTSSTDQAATCLTYYLIAQLILGGGVIPVTGTCMAWFSMILSPMFWAYRAVARGIPQLPEVAKQVYDDRVWVQCLALAVQTLIALVLAGCALKWKNRA